MESNVLVHWRCERRICSSQAQVLDREGPVGLRVSGREEFHLLRVCVLIRSGALPAQSQSSNDGLFSQNRHRCNGGSLPCSGRDARRRRWSDPDGKRDSTAQRLFQIRHPWGRKMRS